MHLKAVKIYIHMFPLLVHFVLQNTWILEVKTLRLGFSLVCFRKHTYWGEYKVRLHFFFELRVNFKTFRVISSYYKFLFYFLGSISYNSSYKKDLRLIVSFQFQVSFVSFYAQTNRTLIVSTLISGLYRPKTWGCQWEYY